MRTNRQSVPGGPTERSVARLERGAEQLEVLPADIKRLARHGLAPRPMAPRPMKGDGLALLNLGLGRSEAALVLHREGAPAEGGQSESGYEREIL